MNNSKQHVAKIDTKIKGIMSDVEIILYGAERCHKTQYYKTYLDVHTINYKLLDVEENTEYDEKLRSLYKSGKRNFPTITIGNKKLRNPSLEKLNKWLDKLTSNELNNQMR
jgi:glutaredoxin